MFTSKQRSNLKAIAQGLEPITQIGKGGISDNLIETVSLALAKRELVKISVLQNAEDDAKSLAVELAEKTQSQVVCVIGKKIVLYKLSDKKGVQHIQF